MNTFRATVAIGAGYVVFALASMTLVGPIMMADGPLVVVLGLLALALIGLVSGALATMLSGSHRRAVTTLLAALVAVATLANLIMRLGAEPTWYKAGTLLLTVPAILLVGRRPQRPRRAT